MIFSVRMSLTILCNCSIYLFHLKVEDWLAEMADFDPMLAQIEDIGLTYESRKQRIIKVPQLKNISLVF